MFGVRVKKEAIFEGGERRGATIFFLKQGDMFRRKNVSKGAKGRGSAKAKKTVKRLLEKPSHDRMAEIADLAMRENLLPFRVREREKMWCRTRLKNFLSFTVVSREGGAGGRRLDVGVGIGGFRFFLYFAPPLFFLNSRSRRRSVSQPTTCAASTA